jgi:hypothetical protein
VAFIKSLYKPPPKKKKKKEETSTCDVRETVKWGKTQLKNNNNNKIINSKVGKDPINLIFFYFI